LKNFLIDNANVTGRNFSAAALAPTHIPTAAGEDIYIYHLSPRNDGCDLALRWKLSQRRVLLMYARRSNARDNPIRPNGENRAL
jgi:hypothetical protein